MEAKVFLHKRSSTSTLALAQRRLKRKPEYPTVFGVLTRPADDIKIETRKTNVNKDNWFDRLAINHLSRSVQAATGSSHPFPFCYNSSEEELKKLCSFSYMIVSL